MKLTTMVTLIVLLTACGGGSTEPAAPPPTAAGTTSAAAPSLENRAKLLAYERSAPLRVVEKQKRTRGGAEAVDLAFQAGERTVSAYLVRPQGKAKAAVLWSHWYGEEANANRTEFLPDAIELAREGATDHALDDEAARSDRLLWLREQLRLS